jgi:hypothetical protein
LLVLEVLTLAQLAMCQDLPVLVFLWTWLCGINLAMAH